MLKKSLLCFSICFHLAFTSFAVNSPGAQVTYRYLNNNKFEVTYKIYKDCRSTSFSPVGYSIRCASTGATKTLSSTRVSIKDINLSCPSTGVMCNPPNTAISGSLTTFEEHTFMDTLDFNGSESAFKSCCTIQIGTGQCCRPASLTTGSTSSDFWVFSTLDLCKAATNSSPVFTFKPSPFEAIYETMMKSFAAKDTIDNDSLSYHFTDPMMSWTNKFSWSTGFDSKNPFTAYYPTNYNKSLGPKPELTPPYGIYLDPITGNLIAMPVNNYEHTVMAIAVKEWRKDGSGKYVQIGEIVIDQTMNFLKINNHLPSITAKMRYNICEDQTFTLELPTDDQPYTLPSPDPAIKNDTLTFTWDKVIKNASYSVINPNIKLPVGKFEWKPATGDSKKSPYTFSAIAIDNNCPVRGMTVKTIQLYVYPKINVSSSIKKLNNSTYAAVINIGNKNYKYLSGKYIVSPNNIEDIRNYYFKSSGTLFSSSDNDTIVFKKNGTYIITQTFLSETDCNTKTLRDTVVISNILEVNFGIAPLGNYYDTSVCQNLTARSFARVTNAKRPVTYTWKTGKFTKTDTLGYLDYAYAATDTLFVSIKDASGQTNSTFHTVNVLEVPELEPMKDVIICPEGKVKLKIKNKKTGFITWTWFKDIKVIGNTDSITVSASGDYVVSGTYINGCALYDTVTVKYFSPIKISLISGVYCQNKEELTHSEIINGNADLNFDVINWQLLKSLPKLSPGQNVLNDLFSDKNPNPAYDFNINFSDSRVTWPGTFRDSLIFSASAIDTNGCKTSDTMTVSVIKMPVISLSKIPIYSCINQAFNLDSFGTTGSQYKWVPFDSDGFGKWPSLSPLASGLISAGHFSKAGKYQVRLEANNEFCLTTDSLAFTISPLPRPVIGVIKNPTTIKFRDETINEKSRKWYINDVFFSSDDTMLLTKTFVHLQPIKLEVTDNNDCTSDTTIIVNTLIGINKIIRSNIEVYPNPSNTVLVLKQTDIWVPSHYEIYDVVGKKVISGMTKSKEEIIDLKNIAPGTYYLKYLNENGIISIPFIRSE